jgi:hypothetical protein
MQPDQTTRECSLHTISLLRSFPEMLVPLQTVREYLQKQTQLSVLSEHGGSAEGKAKTPQYKKFQVHNTSFEQVVGMQENCHDLCLVLDIRGRPVPWHLSFQDVPNYPNPNQYICGSNNGLYQSDFDGGRCDSILYRIYRPQDARDSFGSTTSAEALHHRLLIRRHLSRTGFSVSLCVSAADNRKANPDIPAEVHPLRAIENFAPELRHLLETVGIEGRYTNHQ